MNRSLLRFSPEVRDALSRGEPLVALESTLIAHGLPFPQNLEVARQLEAIVREEGAFPATLGVWEGQLQVGLEPEQLDHFARRGATIPKASRRDLPRLIARRMHGATTVAATMMIAHRAGIPVFATGGIGGVHRGAEKTFDISADLQELARTPVMVVSAGAKAILDLPLTLEYLETLGVPVVGYQTDAFPAFYTRSSGLPLEARAESETEIVEIWRANQALGNSNGLLIANPIPEAYALDPDTINAQIEEAIVAARRSGIMGKALTPFLLAHIEELSEGASLQANVALLENNARLAARLSPLL